MTQQNNGLSPDLKIVVGQGKVECPEDVLLVAVDTIKKESILDENMDDNAIRNSVIYVQDYVIQHVIGTNLYEKIKELIASEWIYDSTHAKYHELLTKYLKPIFIHGVPAELIISNAYKTRNLGTFQINGDNR